MDSDLASAASQLHYIVERIRFSMMDVRRVHNNVLDKKATISLGDMSRDDMASYIGFLEGKIGSASICIDVIQELLDDAHAATKYLNGEL